MRYDLSNPERHIPAMLTEDERTYRRSSLAGFAGLLAVCAFLAFLFTDIYLDKGWLKGEAASLIADIASAAVYAGLAVKLLKSGRLDTAAKRLLTVTLSCGEAFFILSVSDRTAGLAGGGTDVLFGLTAAAVIGYAVGAAVRYAAGRRNNGAGAFPFGAFISAAVVLAVTAPYFLAPSEYSFAFSTVLAAALGTAFAVPCILIISRTDGKSTLRQKLSLIAVIFLFACACLLLRGVG